MQYGHSRARSTVSRSVLGHSNAYQLNEKVPRGSNTPTATPGTRWHERRCIVWAFTGGLRLVVDRALSLPRGCLLRATLRL
jgi:hypothetical protein